MTKADMQKLGICAENKKMECAECGGKNVKVVGEYLQCEDCGAETEYNNICPIGNFECEDAPLCLNSKYLG